MSKSRRASGTREELQEQYENEFDSKSEVELRNKFGKSKWFLNKGSLPVPPHAEFGKSEFVWKNVAYRRLSSDGEYAFDMYRVPIDEREPPEVGDRVSDYVVIDAMYFGKRRPATGWVKLEPFNST